LVDQLNTTATNNMVSYSQHKGVQVKQGCFVQLSGTAPTALVRIGSANEYSYRYDHDAPMVDDFSEVA
jgi:hypothetical protein